MWRLLGKHRAIFDCLLFSWSDIYYIIVVKKSVTKGYRKYLSCVYLLFRSLPGLLQLLIFLYWWHVFLCVSHLTLLLPRLDCFLKALSCHRSIVSDWWMILVWNVPLLTMSHFERITQFILSECNVILYHSWWTMLITNHLYSYSLWKI